MNTAHKLMLSALACTTLLACSDSDDSPSSAQFQVSVTNLTFAQPLSPVAVVLHRSGYNSFVDGETASSAIEILAEGGDNSALLSDAQSNTATHIASLSTDGPIAPLSQSSTLTLDVPALDLSDLRLSVVSMLVHTNDAITGTNAFDVSNMAVGDEYTITGPTWDSGTEANTELATTMPGPDFGGEGFNAARDDTIDRVRIHAGAVTSASTDFGLASSSLADRHRFLNPTSRIQITRVR